MWPGAQRLAQPGRPGLTGAVGWEGAARVPTAQVSKLDSEGHTALRGWPGPPNAAPSSSLAPPLCAGSVWAAGAPDPRPRLVPPPRAPAVAGALPRAFSAHWDLSNIKAERD